MMATGVPRGASGVGNLFSGAARTQFPVAERAALGPTAQVDIADVLVLHNPCHLVAQHGPSRVFVGSEVRDGACWARSECVLRMNFRRGLRRVYRVFREFP